MYFSLWRIVAHLEMNRNIKKIAVLTSGGDSPGMNACIRAVVRTAAYHGLATVGVRHGFQGMIEDDMSELQSHDVSNIIQRGGTILKTSRSKDFHTWEGRKKAYDNLVKCGVEALIVIGGDGSFRGAKAFYDDFGMPCIGLPGTIDKDLAGTDYTIGYDTAINTAVAAIDKIRDTADSHDRMFFVEVMGRDAGFIALESALSVGAEAVLIPQTPTYIDALIEKIEKGYSRKKSSQIIIVAEGDDAGGAVQIAEKVKAKYNSIETRVSILGHIQRGGAPTCRDRVLASQLGHAAVNALLAGENDIMIGVIKDEITYTPLVDANKIKPTIDMQTLALIDILSS